MSYSDKIPDEEQKQRTYENASESRRVNLVDLDIEESSKDGNTEKINVNDSNANYILGELLVEIKKLNLQMAILTDIYLKPEDVSEL